MDIPSLMFMTNMLTYQLVAHTIMPRVEKLLFNSYFICQVHHSCLELRILDGILVQFFYSVFDFILCICACMCVCMCHRTCRGKRTICRSLFSPPCVSQRSNADPPTWQQVPLLTKPFHPARSSGVYT